MVGLMHWDMRDLLYVGGGGRSPEPEPAHEPSEWGIDVAIGVPGEWQRAKCQQSILDLMRMVGDRRIRFYGAEEWDVELGSIVHYTARLIVDGDE